MTTKRISTAEAVARIRTEPAVNLTTAAIAMDVSPDLADRLVRRGQFPVPVIAMGARYVVATPTVRTLLQLDAAAWRGLVPMAVVAPRGYRRSIRFSSRQGDRHG